MYGRFTFATLAVLISLCQAGQAEILSGGPLYGGASAEGGLVTCRIFNFSNANVLISQRRVYNNTGALVALTSDSCANVLAPFKTCAFSSPITGHLAYSCRATYGGSVQRLSGVVEIQKQSQVSHVIPMQNASQ